MPQSTEQPATVQLSVPIFDEDLLATCDAGHVSLAMQLQSIRHLGSIAASLAILSGRKPPTADAAATAQPTAPTAAPQPTAPPLITQPTS